MIPTIETCPHCGAPLPVTRFAATVVCSFCEATVRVDPSAVSRSKYRQAWNEWNEAGAAELSIGDSRWTSLRLLAKGEISDVYQARRARWPSELVVLKTLREADDAPLLEHEWRALRQLENTNLGVRVPAPVESSRTACAYRWAGGFLHTFEAVRDAYREGIPPVASIWVWRRILEVLTVMRQHGLVHGAILPQHLVIQNGEHGVRVVGFSCADRANAPLRVVCTAYEDFYPHAAVDSQKLTSSMDVTMSARCVSYLLGEGEVPAPLAELLQRVASEERADPDPWKLHEQVGALGRELFGPPAFHPIAMKEA